MGPRRGRLGQRQVRLKPRAGLELGNNEPVPTLLNLAMQPITAKDAGGVKIVQKNDRCALGGGLAAN